MRKGYKVFDSDGHVLEPPDLWQRYIEPAYRDQAPVGEYPGIGVQVLGQRLSRTRVGHPEYYAWMTKMQQERYADGYARGFDAQSQLNAMDREGVDVAVLYPTRGLYAASVDGMDPSFAAAVCRAYNNWLHDFCARDPQRLKGAGLVMLYGVEQAIAEAHRAVEELGMVAVLTRPNPVNGRNLHHPDYEPFYSAIEELGVPLVTHEGTAPALPEIGPDRFPEEHIMKHVCSHPMEQMLACLSLTVGGVLVRHPKLQVALLEAGNSWLPFWLRRMDDHWEWLGRFETPWLEEKPSFYFKRQGWIATEADDENVSHTIEQFSEDRIVFATDYPHPDAKSSPLNNLDKYWS